MYRVEIGYNSFIFDDWARAWVLTRTALEASEDRNLSVRLYLVEPETEENSGATE